MTAGGATVGLVVTAAILILRGRPAGARRLRVVTFRAPADRRHLEVQLPVAPRRGTSLLRIWPQRARGCSAPDVGLLITQVSSTVRAGVAPAPAWNQAGVDCDREGLPTPEGLRRAGVSASQGRAVIAACELAREIGTPLAPVLDGITEAIGDESELVGERAAAMAGPRTSARVLTWLPLLGLGLGALMGADPVAVLRGGGWGTVSMVTGVGLMWVGRRWTATLVRAAQRAGVT